MKNKINVNRIKLKSLAKKYDISSLCLFGSYARGDFRKDSDIDILVRFKNYPGFFEFIKLEEKLSELLGGRVDLVTESSISKYIKDSVLKQIKEIYNEK